MENSRSFALLSGVMYLLSGLWPVLHMRSFEAVSGRKTDKWLVKTVGLLLAGVGLTQILSSQLRRPSMEVAVLSTLVPAALAGIDVWYVSRRRISWVYALDAAMELVIAARWLQEIFPRRGRR